MVLGMHDTKYSCKSLGQSEKFALIFFDYLLRENISNVASKAGNVTATCCYIAVE